MRYRTICGLAVASAAALAALRLWQYLWIIDVSTGFYASFSATIPILYGLLAAVFIVTFTVSFLDKSFFEETPALPHRGRALGFFLLLAGAVNLFSSAFGTPDAFLNASQEPKDMIAIILGLIASAVLLYLGVRAVSGHSLTGSSKFLPLLPAAWATIRLLNAFMHNATVLPISENLLTLLSLIAMTVYFLYFAFAVSGNEGKFSRRCFFISGIMGFVLITANALGMLTAAAANAFYALEPYWFITRIADLTVAAVMLCTALNTAFARKPVHTPNAEIAQ
ncbi:hypothetical protein [Acetanaerobacterium elongatum]|uniref:Uncharacterized protein n=1 Tax=Acetanaerobacterium elongatum TaxID=258515 RepID=A0A1G9WNQ7_9FIRM|nr:hypothetical protein [Acetanaerobacterium elongatum]SDM85823.1 hypothetical protein SAMN05192585_10664 [Acetanaerobacterium elongatum]